MLRREVKNPSWIFCSVAHSHLRSARIHRVSMLTANGFFLHRRPAPDSRHRAPLHGDRSAPERTPARPRGKIRRRGNPPPRRTRLLRHADSGGVGRRRPRYDLLRADARRSGARGRLHGRGAQRHQLRRRLAALAARQRRAAAQISPAPRARRNSRRLLPHRAAGRLGRGRHRNARRAQQRRQDVSAQRHEKLGHQRRRKRRLSRFCPVEPSDGLRRLGEGQQSHHRFSRRTRLLRLSREPLRR